MLYQTANHQYYPMGAQTNGLSNAANPDADAIWDKVVQQSLGRKAGIGDANTDQTGKIGDAFTCPSAIVLSSDYSAQKNDYSAHPRIMPRCNDNSGSYSDVRIIPHKVYTEGVKATQVAHSAEIVLVADGAQCHVGAAFGGSSQYGYIQQDGNAFQVFTLADNGAWYQNNCQYPPAVMTTAGHGFGDQICVQLNTEHFLKCVRAGEPSPLSFANAAIVGEIGWAARLSASSGKPVALPLSAQASGATMLLG